MSEELILSTLTVAYKANHSISPPVKTVEFSLHGVVEEYEHSELLDINEVKELIKFLEAWCNKLEGIEND